MKGLLFVILAIIFYECMTGCNTGQYMNDISQISYTSDSGMILPELQWHEEIIITKNKVSLIRNGISRQFDTSAIYFFYIDLNIMGFDVNTTH